jgi:Vault protein inter-alpha-trypsin domain
LRVSIGDDELLLRLCYGATAQPTGLLSAFVVFGDGIWLDSRQRQIAASPAEAREIYYRVHGEPFNAKPAPFEDGKWSRFADFQFDNDHGGTQVGGRLKGLHMVASRIDGSISGDDAVAYLEWTVEFRNSEWTDREARMQVMLPPGGVVSRATLWVNGEEREAAYGGRGEVRAAYQRVAVQQRRDPLLVTSKGADRVLAQAFPVPRNGGTIKFKLGITAPLELIDESKARLTLPAIADRNFSFALDTSHSVWIESKLPLTASAPGIGSSRVDGRLFRISGAVSDRGLSRPRATITVDRNPNAGRLAARIGEGEVVVQEVTRGTPATASLMLVIDGSGRLAETGAKLIEALDAIPPGTKVGAIIAAEPMQRIALPLVRSAEAQRRAPVALDLLHRRPGQCPGAGRGVADGRNGAARDPALGAWATTDQLPRRHRSPRASRRTTVAPARCGALQRRARPERIAARRALGLDRPLAAANGIAGCRSVQLLRAHAVHSASASSGTGRLDQGLRTHRAAVGE